MVTGKKFTEKFKSRIDKRMAAEGDKIVKHGCLYCFRERMPGSLYCCKEHQREYEFHNGKPKETITVREEE